MILGIGALLLKLWTVNSLVFLRLAPITGFSQLNPQINPNPNSHSFARTLLDTWFLIGFSFDNLNHHTKSDTDAISPHLMRALSKEIIESLKASPKCFARFLPELHDILSDDGSLVNWVEFL